MGGDRLDYLLPSEVYDTHVHVFDSQLGPYDPARAYTPEEAPLRSLQGFSAGISSTGLPANLVLVQPSPYGVDNRVLLAALQKLHKDGSRNCRAIAVFDPELISDAELGYMHELGVRGLRLNLQASGGEVNHDALINALEVAADRIKQMPGWKIQIYCPAQTWDVIYDTIINLPVEVIADHFGGLKGSSKLNTITDNKTNENTALEQLGFRSLLKLAEKSRIYIKLSGFYRASNLSETGYSDLAPIVRTLVKRVSDRLVWASDWPHTGEGKDRKPEDALNKTEPFRSIDNLLILKKLKEWVGNDEAWCKIMVSNPKALYA
ncbi:uncharacterized protein F4822DRAFT_332324 [Hypoxylon trugodes]|uniref:uncharacterized protein n=1 Tax=Hypoxylon trugodes TaxID=326681 RepID=UPI002192897F|nr:uncharacterized protein F4822DRAFT_332324 [Hypoxylon trugodes]KAI1387014.1 hypothetical protein F4822DRAFT_332324 [Hypoxylon trugodes]